MSRVLKCSTLVSVILTKVKKSLKKNKPFLAIITFKESKYSELLIDKCLDFDIYFKHYKELKINLEELLFLMYIKTMGTKMTFNPSNMALELGLEIKDIMKLVSSLTEKKLLVINTYKNDKGII